MGIWNDIKYTFWGLRGNKLSHKKKVAKALKVYTEMYEMKPDKIRPLRDKLYCEMALELWTDALQTADKLLAKEPENADFLYAKASILSTPQIAQYEESIAYFDKSLELLPTSLIAQTEKALALMNLNRDDEALECLNQAISINPEYAYWSYCYKAVLMNKNGKKESAIALCKTALATNMGYGFNMEYAENLLKKIRS